MAKARSLAIEFGTQWIHVRNFDSLKEKNEKLFPTFNPALRKAIYVESILFFLDLFQSDRAVTQILDADHTFLDETLAKHYGIPGVNGPQWRRVDGVRKYGRGGVLGLASVHARPLAPEKPEMPRSARTQASCTTSSASARLPRSHRASA